MPFPSASQTFLRELDKKLWTAADRLRSNLAAAVYKHAVPGLIFLKYISDSFARRQAEIEAMLRDPGSDYFLNPKDYGNAYSAGYLEAIRGELEERDYYTEKNVFWVPPLARWKTLQGSAKLPPSTEIKERGRPAHSYKITSTAKLIDDALDAVEKEYPKLKNVPAASVYERRTLKSRIAARQLHHPRTNRRRPKPRKTSDGRRPLQIDPANLAGLIDLIATIPFHCSGAVSASHESATDRRYIAKDILGHNPKSSPSNSSSAPLGGLCAFAVNHYSSSMNMAIRGIDFDFGKEPADTIINHQRYMAPLDRDNLMPFRKEIVDHANEMSIGLMTTWDLYRLVRSAMRWGWPPSSTRPVLYRLGRIDPYIGTITHVWTGALSTNVEEVGLRFGDRIAYELDVAFEEEVVESLKVDKKAVNLAEIGTKAGVSSKFHRPAVKDGMRVFLVQMQAPEAVI